MSNASTIVEPSSSEVCSVDLLVDGESIPATFHCLSLTVNSELNRISSASIQFQDGEAAKSTFPVSNSSIFIPGKPIEIRLGYAAHNQSVFKGIIVKQRLKIRKNENMLEVDCRHKAIKMTSGKKSRYFFDKKDSDIMQELLSLHALQKQVATTGPVLKELVQYDCSDWDFLLCRAEANGQVVMLHGDGVKVAKPLSSATPVVRVVYGSSILELDAEIDARWQSKAIKASAWNVGNQAILQVDANEPAVKLSGNLAPANLAKAMGDATHEIRHGGKLNQAELQAWADARLLKERLAKIRGRVKFQGFAAVLPGDVIKIDGIGERFQGELYVSGVRHCLGAGNWETDVQFGLNPALFAESFDLRPLPAAGLLPAVSGLQIGIVTALEKDPEGEERIKVRLPLINSNEDGIWARLATLDAGKERGMFFRPEIQDEVIVGFLNEDPRHPVVLGMCHSSAKPAPEAAKDSNHLKGYVSREKLKLSFDDEKKIITLETPAGNKLCLTEDAKGILIQDQNGNKITLDDKGIKIESAKDLILKASSDFKLEATNIALKSQSAFKASGAVSAELSSSAGTTIKSSAVTTIQGGLVKIN